MPLRATLAKGGERDREYMVTSIVRRVLGVAVIAVLLGTTGIVTGIDQAGAITRPIAAGSSPGNPPSGGTKVLGAKFDGFCVKNFKPNSTVTVVNQLTGTSVKIQTNAKGAGCANVPLKRACNAVTQKLVATGVGANGKPATVSAIVRAPATASLCSGRQISTSPGNSGGTLPFTGANIAIMVAIGLILIGIGSAVVMSVRRRRHNFA